MDTLLKSEFAATNGMPAEKLGKKIASFRDIKLFTHKNPDGDAIGSILALYRIFSLNGKNAEIFVFDSIDERFSFFPNFEKIKIRKKPDPLDGDLAVYVDCSEPSRTGFEEKFFENKEAVAIDHHQDSGQEKTNVLKAIDPGASSTAEVIFDLASRLGWKTDRDASICLLGGIMADTGAFQHSNTSPKSLQIVSHLVKNGINLKKIAEKLFKKREFGGSLKIWGQILSRAALDSQTKMAFSYVSMGNLKKYGSDEEELSGLVNLLAGIPESRFSLLLTENKFGKIKGSLRSESYKGVDVAKIAKAFGGGGHKLAAGFEVEGKIEEKLGEIKKKIREELVKQQ